MTEVEMSDLSTSIDLDDETVEDPEQIRMTVIVPVHNAGAHLVQCLNSLVRQTLDRTEFLCIDDGSTDDSARILDTYAKYDPRFRIIHQKNVGVGPTRNRGLDEARGAYVAFMDADDYYPSHHTLKKLWVEAEASGVAIAGGSFSEDHGNGKTRTSWTGIYAKYTFPEDGLVKYKDYQFDYGFHRFIYKTSFLREHDLHFPPYIRFQDPPFFVRAMALAGSFYAVALPTYRYRWGHQKLTWDERRTLDLVKGLRDNLRIAVDFDLDGLRDLTWGRLAEEYRDRILARVAEGDVELKTVLAECQALAPVGATSIG
ncbi:glycosyltransferase [Nocardioides sp.]|uniref:glycosyltransferase family 2 protein n=1 Tax=Nocardioides sp. TaxID=35761 RepID=UPI00260CD93C|nr:glycosyltransferase [Nocardioides sp.]